jgi:hypothetical protein
MSTEKLMFVLLTQQSRRSTKSNKKSSTHYNGFRLNSEFLTDNVVDLSKRPAFMHIKEIFIYEMLRNQARSQHKSFVWKV